MRRWWKILLLGACGVIAVVAVCFFCLRENEPSYNGRTLSGWLRPVTHPVSAQQWAKCEEAVRAIDVKAIPCLLTWVDERSRFREFLANPVMPDSVRHAMYTERLAAKVRAKHLMAIEGFRILKTNAAPALAELERRFNTETDPQRASALGYSIGNLGTPALKFLLEVIAKNPSNFHARAAIAGIGEMKYLGTNAADAVPVLLKQLQNTNDWQTMHAASDAAGRLALMPVVIVPALTNMFASSNVIVRRDAMRALYYLNDRTTVDVPKAFVRVALDDPDKQVHFFATNLARSFAPEFLTNRAGVKN